MGRPAWRARLGAGVDLDVRRAPDGTHRFRLAGQARYEVSPSADTVAFAHVPGDLLALREFCDSILGWSALVRGYEGLHASAVDIGGRAIALIAPSGVGKTTLAAGLLARKHRLVTDDLLMVCVQDGQVCAVPATPLMNLPRIAIQGDEDWIDGCHGVLDEEAWVSVRRATERPTPLAALVMVQRGGQGEANLRRTEATTLDLLGHALGARGLRGRERGRFLLFSRIAEEVPSWSLEVPEGTRTDTVLDLLEDECFASSGGGR